MTVVESVGHDVEILSDILYGWDGPGLDFDSTATPSGADLVSSRMLTIALAHRREGLSSESSDLEKLKVTFAMLPKKHGGSAAFVSFGGLIDVDVPLDERWQLAMKLEGGGTLSATIGSPTHFLAGDAQHALRIGLATKPDPDTNLAFVLPDTKGCRLEFGQVSFALTLASDEAQFKTRVDNGAVVLESGDSDGFISNLLDRALGGAPMRLPFAIAVGYSSTRGLILEGEAPPFTSPAKKDAAATPDSGTTSAVPRLADDAPAPTSAQPELPVLSSGGNVGASPTIDATIPIGRSFGALTIHEVQLRLGARAGRRRREDRARHRRVVQRAHRPGVCAHREARHLDRDRQHQAARGIEPALHRPRPRHCRPRRAWRSTSMPASSAAAACCSTTPRSTSTRGA